MSEQEEIREMVDQAKSPGVFSIINVLNERAYPKASVAVSLDEASAYEAAMLKEEIEKLEKKASDNLKVVDKIEEMHRQLDDIVEKMAKYTYTFHIRGISEGKREELIAQARKKYPIEYEKPSDISALIGGNQERIEKPSPERDNLFTDLLWVEHLEMIEDPDGNVQTNLTYSDIRALRNSLPLSALAKINTAMEKVRTATAVFMMETGEDFLAKP